MKVQVKQSTQMMREIRDKQDNKAVDSYFLICQDTIVDFFFKSRSTRRKYLHDMKQYAVIVFLTLHHKNSVIRRCLERTYTLSSDNFGTDFKNFMEKMVKILDDEYFESKFQKLYRELSSDTSIEMKKMEEIADYMLKLIKNTDFSVLKDLKNDLTEDGRVMVKKLYLIDKTYTEFGVEIEEILKFKNKTQKNKRLESKFMKIAQSLRVN